MSTRSERDKQKSLQEKHQSILSGLLKDEDNKYCVDCDAKGPRWASWNLGVFLCIRCAGIHRNLGVHISKVKSVNLDSWTSEQLSMVQEMGNSRARAVYEANLPDNFRRPQTDSSLEAFIRAKYEQKKYIAREWVPPQPKAQPVEEKKEKKKSRPRPSPTVNIGSKSTENNHSISRPEATAIPQSAPEPPKKESASVDLLGLETPQSADNSDPFGDFLGVTDTQSTNDTSSLQNNTSMPQPASSSDQSQEPSLFGESVESGGEKKSTKESILALYGSNTQQQQMYGVPGGMYMSNQQQNFVGSGGVPVMGNMQNGMMGNNMMQANMGMMAMSANQPMQQPNTVARDPMWDAANAQRMAALGMMGQQPYMAQQQPNMMMGQMPGVQQVNMMGQHPGMMAAPNMYNTHGMYSAQQQQQQLQQVQNQMASMKMGNTGMGSFQQPAAMATAGGGSWNTQATGTTLSNNLWQ